MKPSKTLKISACQGIQSEWILTTDHLAHDHAPRRDRIMAWAHDRDTHKPVYIHELDSSRAGAKSGCVCPSCNAELTAINVGKQLYEMGMRKHFRHPHGKPRESCLVGSARAAALHLFQEEGLLELPGRHFDIPVEGLNGKVFIEHKSWPAEQVRVCRAETQDAVTALLYLDDGRVLQVRLTGTPNPGNSTDGHGVASLPTILVSVNDPELASLSPEDLRSRLRLLLLDGHWCSHWQDEAQTNEALEEVRDLSLEWDDGTAYVDLPRQLRTETLLHLKAKELLQQAGSITLPSHNVSVSDTTLKGELLERQRTLPRRTFTLVNVRLEKPMGAIRPDVVASVADDVDWPSHDLLIEITVTNQLTHDRLERIRSFGFAAVEIDLSSFSGIVTEHEFSTLLTDVVVGKRWIHHPEEFDTAVWLDMLLKDEKQRKDESYKVWQEATANREHYRQAPIEHWRDIFLDSVVRLGDLEVALQNENNRDKHPDFTLATKALREGAKGLAVHGYHQGIQFYLRERKIERLWKLLSIRHNRAIGSDIQTSWRVLNTLFSERRQEATSWHTFYLTAVRIYHPTLTSAQAKRIQVYRVSINKSLENNEENFRRENALVTFIALLLPEMKEIVTKKIPGE